jgi:DNA-binding NtrC family response regulator
MKSVLIVDADPGIQSCFLRDLSSRFGLIETAGDTQTATALLERCHFDLLLADIHLPDRSGVEWMTELRDKGDLTPVIFITACASLETVIDALRVGAMDFILKPFRLEQVLAAIDRCLEQQQLRRENFVLRRQLEQHLEIGGIVGECEAVHSICQIIRQVAPMPSTILIEGESGTGKELAARAIHALSQRSGHFVSVNYDQACEGLFAYANGGTLFLDEIGAMPLAMQVHLLRVLDEQRIRPLGSSRETPIDVRILAATNGELEQKVKQGKFRADLFYRLNVLSIRLPPLRERGRDVELLAQHFINRLSSELSIKPIPLDKAEILRLQAYGWPGNVRELKNVIERALLLGIMPSQCLTATPVNGQRKADTDDLLLLEEVEKRHILRVLDMEDSNKSAAARQLGISRKTLERKLNAWALGHDAPTAT